MGGGVHPSSPWAGSGSRSFPGEGPGLDGKWWRSPKDSRGGAFREAGDTGQGPKFNTFLHFYFPLFSPSFLVIFSPFLGGFSIFFHRHFFPPDILSGPSLCFYIFIYMEILKMEDQIRHKRLESRHLAHPGVPPPRILGFSQNSDFLFLFLFFMFEIQF